MSGNSVIRLCSEIELEIEVEVEVEIEVHSRTIKE